MRRLGTLLLGMTLSLGAATASDAAVIEWAGTLIVRLSPLPPVVHIGTGVATVNASSGLGHLSTIHLAGGLSYTGGVSVPETIPLTDPEAPTATSIRATGVRLGPLSLNGISGGPPLGSKNTGIVLGRMKICVNNPGCPTSYVIPFATPSGNAGIGVGGTVTTTTTDGFWISLHAAPWTVGSQTVKSVVETDNGGLTTYTKTIQGFVHGPASATSNTAAIGGVLQVVTPVVTQSSVCEPGEQRAGSAELKLRFVPEPSALLLLSANVAALLALARKRMKP